MPLDYIEIRITLKSPSVVTKSKVQWSTTVKLITSLTIVGVIVSEYYIIKDSISSNELLLQLVATTIVGVILYFFFKAPLYIELRESELIVKKINGRIRIYYEEIKLVEPFKTDFSNIRLMGSGGFCGYIGTFRNTAFGSYESYVGSYKQAFHIETKKGEHFVFSCKDRETIIEIINRKISERPSFEYSNNIY